MKAEYEKITRGEHSAINAFIFEKDTFDAPWHFHPEYELTYILKGRGMRYVGDNIQDFQSGDFVLLGSNLPHCWKNSSEYKDSAKSLVIQWKNDLLGADWLNKQEFFHIKTLLAKSASGITFNPSIKALAKKKMSAIIESSPFHKTMLLLELLDSLSNTDNHQKIASASFTLNSDHGANHRIVRVLNFLESNYQGPIALAELSGMLGLSDATFCRFFKKNFGKSFFTYLNEYRIGVASKLLIETDLLVSEIAFKSGYESLPFFCRQFKKLKSSSPNVYRKTFMQLAAIN